MQATVANPGYRYPRSILEPPSDRTMIRGIGFGGSARKGIHPTQKNLFALAWLIRSYSHPGQLVLDPLMGCGSTGVAALRTGRRFLGIELEAKYFDAACARLEEAQALGADLLVDPHGYDAWLAGRGLTREQHLANYVAELRERGILPQIPVPPPHTRGADSRAPEDFPGVPAGHPQTHEETRGSRG